MTLWAILGVLWLMSVAYFIYAIATAAPDPNPEENFRADETPPAP